jgi:hypothetical protein
MVTIGNRSCSGRCGGWAGDGLSTSQINDTITNSQARCPNDFKKQMKYNKKCKECIKSSPGKFCLLLIRASGGSPLAGKLGHCLPIGG